MKEQKMYVVQVRDTETQSVRNSKPMPLDKAFQKLMAEYNLCKFFMMDQESFSGFKQDRFGNRRFILKTDSAVIGRILPC